VIRQVITCDICGSEKGETNHWFVGYEESGELRISDWNPLHLLSPEAKHLCGETCAHKLISQFLREPLSSACMELDILHSGLRGGRRGLRN
jgi:hypothetical protein